MCLCNVDLDLNSAKLHIEAKIVPLMVINRTIRVPTTKNTLITSFQNIKSFPIYIILIFSKNI